MTTTHKVTHCVGNVMWLREFIGEEDLCAVLEGRFRGYEGGDDDEGLEGD